MAHAYASHLREANAARVILEAPLLARIEELEKALIESGDIRLAELIEKAALLALLHEIETLLKSLGMLASNGANYGSTNTERLRLLASIDRALGAGGAT